MITSGSSLPSRTSATTDSGTGPVALFAIGRARSCSRLAACASSTTGRVWCSSHTRPAGTSTSWASIFCASCDGVRCSAASSAGRITSWICRTRPPVTSTPPTPSTRTSAGRTISSATSRNRRRSVSTPFGATTLKVITGTDVGSTRWTTTVEPFGNST